MNISIYKPSDWVTFGLAFSLTIGQVEQWSGIYGSNTILWLIHYLMTLSVLSIFVLAAEKKFVALHKNERQAFFYLMQAMVVWYFQKIYVLKKSENISGFEEGCQSELLLVTSITTAYIITLCCVAAFSGLLFLT
tara:strand:- start:27 stop:431 length:405 start_codon:yes stop_codon:yes gene_type:complete